ncbi:hypothetical protein [Synechococcus sp. PCC 7502]|uniref:hypothetical protein n=1 Tax=Synechococcus sp. PCC 7502 TaxID=1173263 RepID=UPI00031E068D|nr:hypothetical protein [Synechococcus sp. PCC 7502]
MESLLRSQFDSVIGFDKERSFYPVVLIVIATLYLLFAAIAAFGFRKNVPKK